VRASQTLMLRHAMKTPTSIKT